MEQQERETSEDSEQYPRQITLDEEKRLRFAGQILLVLATIFIGSMLLAFWQPVNGDPIFEACKTAIPPIVTLILGFYFGQK